MRSTLTTKSDCVQPKIGRSHLGGLERTDVELSESHPGIEALYVVVCRGDLFEHSSRLLWDHRQRRYRRLESHLSIWVLVKRQQRASLIAVARLQLLLYGIHSIE